jgi:hypothetical protein
MSFSINFYRLLLFIELCECVIVKIPLMRQKLVRTDEQQQVQLTRNDEKLQTFHDLTFLGYITIGTPPQVRFKHDNLLYSISVCLSISIRAVRICGLSRPTVRVTAIRVVIIYKFAH